MTHHHHDTTHHHHDSGVAHPAGHVAPSLLRMSVVERLGIAAIAAVLLWGAVWWAIG
jgi:hypothetical protein